MKKRIFLLLYSAFAIVILLSGYSLTLAADSNAAKAAEAPEKKETIEIAMIDERPVSIDRLLLTAFEDIGYHTVFSYMTAQAGYEAVNKGEKEAISSVYVGLEKLYPNLVKVPVPLEDTIIRAIARKDSSAQINDWSGLSGYKVGVLSQRQYTYENVLANSPKSITQKVTTASLLDGLIAGEYDIAVISRLAHEESVLPDALTYVGTVDKQQDFLYLNKKHESLIPSISEALNNMAADGRAENILNDEALPGGDDEKTILHILSTNVQLAREEQFITSLKETVGEDSQIDWYTVELISRRYPSDPSRLSYHANLLRQESVSRNISAIIVSGDDALRFLLEYYFLYFRNVPVLFYGVNEDYSSAIKGHEGYFTGITEQLSSNETISAALKLFPDTKNLFVVNDYTTEGNYYRAGMERQLAPLSGTVNIEYSENTDAGTLFRHINELSEDTVVLFGSYFRDSIGQYYPLQTIKRMLEKDCLVPIFTVYSTNVEYDAIGGKSLDYEKNGKIIGNMLVRILNGEKVSDIPVEADPENYSTWVFDAIKMSEFNIKKSSLPFGSQIINQNLSIWETDPRFAAALVALLFVGVSAASVISYLIVRNRKQKELVIKDDKIREIKDRLERIINTAPLAFMLTVDGVIADGNEYLKKNIGLKKGDNPSLLYHNPNHRKKVLDMALSEDWVWREIIEFNTLKGVHRFLANIKTTEYEGRQGFLLWGIDIEESERQKDELNTTKQNLQMILDTMPVALRILDSKSMEIAYANNSCLRMFGCDSLSEMKGKQASYYMPPVQSDGSDTREKLELLISSDETTVMEIEYLSPGGGIMETVSTISTIDYEGKKSKLAMIVDLTAEKAQQRMLLSAAEKEKEANQLKSRFLVNMSHEIRTPMNAIIGLTEIELRKSPSLETKDIYKKINISAKNLLEIINDILDLSKIEADKIELYNEEFELEDVLNSALLVASPRLDGKNVEFMLDLSLDLPRYIVGDRTRLWQILKNFLDNSAKYTENGKIVLSAFTDKARTNEETISITFTIVDTGIGIEESQMKKLFLPYEQIRNEAQKKYSGTGLGMAISKQLCEIMGGVLEVQSIVGTGTTISISIPFSRSANTETELQNIKSPLLEGMDILAVDDDPLSLEIMSNMLTVAGANCVLAQSGFQAMEIILDRRDNGLSFDMILLDYMMDGLNGLETARQIHLALSKAPKLLMVTAYQKLLLKNDLEENGIDAIIEKPFIPTQFMRKIYKMLDFEDYSEQPEELLTTYSGVTVLLCEDYRLNQEVAAGMFAQFGVEAKIAEDGQQGIDLLNSGEQFDIIFMDLQMPVMDGYEATRIIRADSRFDKIPIVSLTADAMKEVVDKCMEIGMNDHIAKPIEFSALSRVFYKWLPESKRVFIANAQEPAIVIENTALARFGGNRERLERSLLDFAENLLPENWDPFDKAIENKDETEKFIHKLKGTAGNLDEKLIYTSAAKFESSLRAGNPDKLLYQELIDASERSRKRLLAHRQIQNVELHEAGTPEQFYELLEKLKNALDDYNPVASGGVVNLLKEKSWPFADEAQLRQLYERVRKYDFDTALEMLDTIRR